MQDNGQGNGQDGVTLPDGAWLQARHRHDSLQQPLPVQARVLHSDREVDRVLWQVDRGSGQEAHQRRQELQEEEQEEGLPLRRRRGRAVQVDIRLTLG